MSEYRLTISDFAPTGAGWPKISGRRSHPTNHSPSQKTMLNDLSYGIKICPDFSFILSKSTCLRDGLIDTFLATRPPCIQCSTVEIPNWNVYHQPTIYSSCDPAKFSHQLCLAIGMLISKLPLIFSKGMGSTYMQILNYGRFFQSEVDLRYTWITLYAGIYGSSFILLYYHAA